MNSVAVRIWAGRIVSCAPVLIVLMSARWKLMLDPWYVREWGRLGSDTQALPFVASLQLAAIVLFVIPRTAILGAILLTGYMGGAIASYVRIGELSAGGAASSAAPVAQAASRRMKPESPTGVLHP